MGDERRSVNDCHSTQSPSGIIIFDEEISVARASPAFNTVPARSAVGSEL
jgi:hypothetical protein